MSSLNTDMPYDVFSREEWLHRSMLPAKRTAQLQAQDSCNRSPSTQLHLCQDSCNRSPSTQLHLCQLPSLWLTVQKPSWGRKERGWAAGEASHISGKLSRHSIRKTSRWVKHSLLTCETELIDSDTFVGTLQLTAAKRTSLWHSRSTAFA